MQKISAIVSLLVYVDLELLFALSRLSLTLAAFLLRFRVSACDAQVLRLLLFRLALHRLEVLLGKRRFFLQRYSLPLMLLDELDLVWRCLLGLPLALLVDERLLERPRLLEWLPDNRRILLVVGLCNALLPECLLFDRRARLASRLLLLPTVNLRHIGSRLLSLLCLLRTLTVEDHLLERLAFVAARECRLPFVEVLLFDRRNLLALRLSPSLTTDEPLLGSRFLLVLCLFMVLRLEDVLLDDLYWLVTLDFFLLFVCWL